MGLEYLSEGLSDDFKWYILHVLSGFEAKVQQSLKERITTHKMLEHFAQIYVPQEQVTVNVAGKKKSMKKKFFPGYILIKMKMSEASWHLVQNTDKVTGFVGGEKGKPIPIADEEAQAMLVQATGGFKKAKSGAHFSQGDSVKVIEGPFTSFVGMVEEVNDKGRLKVQVSIFGRPTPVELDFTQVEKV
ncbi:MAG: transcription termination/antitermination protein NusG [Bacteriovoracaceae bacterium]|nr:transcription termination/antitermination protein NusG [Bacteriovoracaceae bacterium]